VAESEMPGVNVVGCVGFISGDVGDARGSEESECERSMGTKVTVREKRSHKESGDGTLGWHLR